MLHRLLNKVVGCLQCEGCIIFNFFIFLLLKNHAIRFYATIFSDSLHLRLSFFRLKEHHPKVNHEKVSSGKWRGEPEELQGCYWNPVGVGVLYVSKDERRYHIPSFPSQRCLSVKHNGLAREATTVSTPLCWELGDLSHVEV